MKRNLRGHYSTGINPSKKEKMIRDQEHMIDPDGQERGYNRYPMPESDPADQPLVEDMVRD